MQTTLAKLRKLISRGDERVLLRMLFVVLCLAILEVASIFSVLPFMNVATSLGQENPGRLSQYVQGYFPDAEPKSILIGLGCVVLAVQIASAFFTVFSSWLMARTTWQVAHNVSMRMIDIYTRIPYETLAANDSSTLVRKAISDIQGLATGILRASCQCIAAAFKSLLVMALLFAVNPKLAGTIFGVFGAVYLLVFGLRQRHLRKLGQERIDVISARLKWFTLTLGGIKTLRVDRALPYFVDKYERSSRHFSRLQPLFSIYRVLPRTTIELCAFGGIIVLVLGLLLADIDLMSVVPSLTVFALAAYKLLPAISQVFSHAATVTEHLPVIEELHRDWSTFDTADQLLPPAKEYRNFEPMPFEESLRLHAIGFSYQSSGSPVLRDVDVTIPKHAKVAFVGTTGCGKSTIVDLVVGLLSPSEGEVIVDQQVITAEDVLSWRMIMSYVPQEVFLYDASVAANIALGVAPQEIDAAAMDRAIEIAQLRQVVDEELPDGLQTLLGENGTRLSGGQRQRVGLARALYKQPQVLVLDEATSALDNITEEAFTEALNKHLPDVTMIMVAHRLTSIKKCDAIYLVANGQIADSGTFEDLQQRNSQFREMAAVTQAS